MDLIYKVSSLIVGFITFIIGIIILLDGIFNMIPTNATNENITIWVLVLIFGFVLIAIGIITITYLKKE